MGYIVYMVLLDSSFASSNANGAIRWALSVKCARNILHLVRTHRIEGRILPKFHPFVLRRSKAYYKSSRSQPVVKPFEDKQVIVDKSRPLNRSCFTNAASLIVMVAR